MIRAAGLALAGFLTASPATQPQMIGVADETATSHKLSGPDAIEVDKADEAGLSGTWIDVTVSPDGDVTDAHISYDGDKQPGSAALLAAARQWKFRPFTYAGRPVVAITRIEIEPRLKPIWAKPDTPFPAIDYAHLKIELTRSACYGSCPDYKVSIDGAGNVVFSTREAPADPVSGVHREFSFGRPGVLVGGVHRGKIDRATLDALIAQFRDAHFFGLKKEYSYPVTDNPTQVVRFASGPSEMTVTDYVGTAAGLPPVAKALERAIDDAVGTARWVSGNGETVAALKAEGFDPAGDQAAELAVGALGAGSDQVVVDLIAAGLPLDRLYKSRTKGAVAAPLGSILLVEAVSRGHAITARALLDRGWAARTDHSALRGAFVNGGGGCDIAVARALVDAGVDPKTRLSSPTQPGGAGADRTMSGALAEAKSAIGPPVPGVLAIAVDRYAICRDELAARQDLVRGLIALGVDVNARDGEGKSALFGLESPVLVDILLAAGARADVKDSKGLSPAFSSRTDEIVLRLLDAGADTSGTEDGKTLRQIAAERQMPGTLAWLSTHGIK
jgi:hypothetical protein